MMRNRAERKLIADERARQHTAERRELRMTDAYHIGTAWEQTAKEYYGHDCVSIEFNVATGLYCTNIGGRVSKWKHGDEIELSTKLMQADMQQRELTANIPSEDI